MLTSTEYTVDQIAELDGINIATVRKLTFEVTADCDSDGCCEGMEAVLVRIEEHLGGELAEIRKFARDDQFAKRFGKLFMAQVEESDSLREELEAKLMEDRESQLEPDTDSAWKNRGL